MIRNSTALLQRIRDIHAHIRDEVVRETERSAIETLSTAVGEGAGDTIFAIDRVSEEALLAQFGELSGMAARADRRRLGHNRAHGASRRNR